MGVHDLGRLREKRNLLDDLIAVIGVLLHDRHFIGFEFARLVQNLVGNGHLADVMQKGSAGDRIDLFAGQSHGACNRDGKGGYALGVAFGFAVFQVQRVAQEPPA